MSQGQGAVGAVIGSSISMSHLMSSCPHLAVQIGGVQVPCLVDTGSMVSTITESCFRDHFEPWGQDQLKSCQWLQLWAANGLSILGYMELDVELGGEVISKCGVLVVRDPPGGICTQVPGVLGMNVLSRCYQELFGRHGPALFDLAVTVDAPSFVMQAFQHCHRMEDRGSVRHSDLVRLRGRKSCRIPGGMMKFVAATCSEKYAEGVVLFEPPESGLPAGLLASPALVQVIRGPAYLPVVNVRTADVMLHYNTVLGMLNSVCVVSLPAGITEVKPVAATVSSQAMTVAPAVQEQIDAVDFSVLPELEQGQVRALLCKF